jgi:hypothetical protein
MDGMMIKHRAIQDGKQANREKTTRLAGKREQTRHVEPHEHYKIEYDKLGVRQVALGFPTIFKAESRTDRSQYKST